MRSTDAILTLESLEIGFVSGRWKKSLLPPLTSSAGQGELIAVIGRNGIGKSTLLRSIAGLQPVISGSLTIGGKEIADYSRKGLAEKVGYVSTEIVRVSNLSVYELAAQGRFPHTNWYGTIDTANHEAVAEALSRAGMTAFSGRMISELSDGERQRAMIAMVLAQDAVIMVMDEPTAFLDIRSRFEILHLLHDLTREKGKTVIFSTHDLDAALSQADKIWLMLEDGFTEGAPEDLVLSGSIGRLFDESVVSFNSHNGTFLTRNKPGGAIRVAGKGDQRYWTEKAVIRSGFAVSDKEFSATITLPGAENRAWKIETEKGSREFGTLYSLASWLRNNP
jgi:iron complex transport system ATP-binding protein